jgi:hypothetical protein
MGTLLLSEKPHNTRVGKAKRLAGQANLRKYRRNMKQSHMSGIEPDASHNPTRNLEQKG